MTPYLSVVMGIGGNLTEDLRDRLTTSISMTIALAEESCVPTEIIVVAWNAPLFRMSAREPLSLACPVRAIQTGDLHSHVHNPHDFKYLEWPPKNIGIRRARGEFVLSTNPDDIFVPEMFEFFARRELQHGHFYRANRHDTQDGRVFRICYPTGAKSPDSTPEQIKQNAPRACPWSENMLHYNASGDFTLMAKDDWFLIHGNPELEYNDSIDGQTLWLAHQKGLKQVVLPYPIYHPDHPRTLNLMNGVQPFDSKWDDNFPHAKQNDDTWGFRDMIFEETIL